MIISASWLQKWVSTELSATQIAEKLTTAGLEVEGITPLTSASFEKICVGKITAIEKHPDANKLQITHIDIGQSANLQIVCGASNVRIDMLVAVATIGAVLPNGTKIKKAKLRGVPSEGMLCSALELGLAEQSNGILSLDDTAVVGESISQTLQLDDTLIEIDLTPNRGDCLSIQGVARDLALIEENAHYRPATIPTLKGEGKSTLSVEVNETEACPKYSARVINNINTQTQTPLWLTEQLRRAGLRSVNPIVDITNYVMLELGQPLHAFDYDRIEGQRIIVRKAKNTENITLLDGNCVTLKENTLIIADTNKALAIAGVMGGTDSSITGSTKHIVLESAHFSKKQLAGTARQYGLHTDASHRFERGVDPEMVDTAMHRASELIIAICGGIASECVIKEDSTHIPRNQAITLRYDRVNSLLGTKLSTTSIQKIAQRLGKAHLKDQQCTITAPSYRFDIECEADIIEEIARIITYDSIPDALPRIALQKNTLGATHGNLRQLQHFMVARGYHEAITYSFIDAQWQQKCVSESGVRVSNPISEKMNTMRCSLLPGLLQSLAFNYHRQQLRIRLFECGATYHQADQIISENQRVAGVICDIRHPLQWGHNNKQKVDFYDIKSDVVELISAHQPKKNIHWCTKEGSQLLHPGQSATLYIDDKKIGIIGQIHPTLTQTLDIDTAVFVFELSLVDLMTTSLTQYRTISKQPSIKRDINIVVSELITAETISNNIKKCLQNVLKSITIFDVYRGKGISEQQKSLSFRLTLQDDTKTLTDNDADVLINEALNVLASSYNASLRS